MMLTGGQSKFEFIENNTGSNGIDKTISDGLKLEGISLVKLETNQEDLQRHKSRLSEISDKHSIETIWSKH